MTKTKLIRWRKLPLGSRLFWYSARITTYRMYVKTCKGWKPILKLIEGVSIPKGGEPITTYWVDEIVINLPLQTFHHLGSQGLKRDATLKEAKALVETYVLMHWHEVEKFKESFYDTERM